MKKIHYFYTAFLLVFVYIVFSSNSGGPATVGNSDYTGAPSAGLCGNCHSGGSFGQVTLNIQVFHQGTTTPVNGYIGGTSYDVRVTVNKSAGNPAGYGFQLTCLSTPGNQPAGTYSNLATNVKQKNITSGTFNGRRYVEQSGVTNNNQFNFRWTAPTSGTGSVRFYAAGNAVNGGSSSGDNAGSTTLTLNELTPLSVSGNQTDVSCFNGNNGSVNITVSGGSTPYTFLWNDGATTEDRTNLIAGSYTVTVTDNASATATATFSIAQPLEQLTVSGTVLNVNCNGGNNGSIITSVNGGTPNYTYNWGGGITTANRSNLTAGGYSVTVTDSKSCTASASFQVSQPTALGSTFSFLPILCFGGNTTIQVSPTGGTAPYNVTPNNFTVSAGNYLYTVTDNNNCSTTLSVNVPQPSVLNATANDITIPCSGGSGTITVSANGGTAPYSGTGNFTVTTPGSYSYVVTDQNGCTATATANAQSNTGLTSVANIQQVSCNNACDGSITVNVTGGSPPFSIHWSNGNGSNLCAGSYQVTVSDNSGCQLINSYTINEPVVLTSSISTLPILCFGYGTELTANVSGGTSPYTFAWSNFENGQQTTATAGNITVTVTDANLCSTTSTLNLTQPDSISISIIGTTIPSGTTLGAIDISVTGGVAPYIYLWSNGSTNEDIADLNPGVYDITITDANQCSAVLSVSLLDAVAVPKITDEDIAVYPNPFSNTLQLSVNEKSVLYVYSMVGKIVLIQQLHTGTNTIWATELAPSQYIIEVHGTNNTLRKLLIKN